VHWTPASSVLFAHSAHDRVKESAPQGAVCCSYDCFAQQTMKLKHTIPRKGNAQDRITKSVTMRCIFASEYHSKLREAETPGKNRAVDPKEDHRESSLAAKFYPYEGVRTSYILPKVSHECPKNESDLPIPPQELWLGYGKTREAYLTWGRDQIRKMKDILEASVNLEGARELLR
jgi:hypothetical protein